MSLISGWQRKISVWCFDLWNLQNDYFNDFFNPKWGTFKGPLGPQKIMLLNFCLVSLFFLSSFGFWYFPFVCYFSLFLFCFLVLVPSLLG